MKQFFMFLIIIYVRAEFRPWILKHQGPNYALEKTFKTLLYAKNVAVYTKHFPGKIVWLLSPASWRLWACFNSLSDSSLATGLNAELGRLCPKGGTHFQLVPLGSPQGCFMGKFSPLTSIKFLPPMPPIQNIRP